MATINKDFKIKNGLVVGGSTATVNGNQILTENASDQYIINLIGGEAFIKSVDTNTFDVDGAGNLTVKANVFDAYGSASTAETNANTYTDTALNYYTPTASLDTAITGYGYLKSADLMGYATESFVTSQGYLVSSDLTGYATETYVGNQGFITSAALTGYATESYVGSQGFATESFVTSQGYLISSDLIGYATETYVGTEISTHAGLTSTHGVSGNIVGTTDTQDLSNKRIIDTLYFTDGVTVANEGEIAVRAVSHDFNIQANYGDLHLKTVATGSDVQITSQDGDILLNADGKAYYGTASAENEIATHGYVDNAISGLDWKQSVNVLANANVALTGSIPLSIDSHELTDGYRVLLTAQSNTSQNGIYDFSVSGSSYTLSRSTDADAYSELVGAAVYVMEGTQYGSTSWVQGNHYLSDFTGQTWTQFSGQGSVTAGSGIIVNGLEVSIDRTTVDDWYDAYGSAAAITPASLGLGNVDNTSDANKPVSTATQTALNLKANAANPTLTGSLTLDGTGDFTVNADAGIILQPGTFAYLTSATAANKIATEGYVDDAIAGVTVDYAAMAGTYLDWSGTQFDVNATDLISGAGIATETFVTTQGYLLPVDLTGYATESFVTTQGYLTSADLTGYATETYVSTNYVASVDLDTNVAALGYAKTVDLPTQYTDQDALNAINGSTITPLSVEINGWRKEEAARITIANASTANLHSFSYPYESAKYLVRVVGWDAGVKHSQITEILMTVDGNNNIAITEYGNVYTSTDPLASFSATYDLGNYILTTTTAVAGCEVIAAATMLSWAD